MPSATLTGLAGVAIAVASICVYHLTVVGPGFRRLRRILSGEAGPGDAAAADVRARGLEGAFAKRTEDRLAELERLAAHDVYRVGFVRYNSFSDVGSDLSYALALVNQDGDSVVVSSICRARRRARSARPSANSSQTRTPQRKSCKPSPWRAPASAHSRVLAGGPAPYTWAGIHERLPRGSPCPQAIDGMLALIGERARFRSRLASSRRFEGGAGGGRTRPAYGLTFRVDRPLLRGRPEYRRVRTWQCRRGAELPGQNHPAARLPRASHRVHATHLVVAIAVCAVLVASLVAYCFGSVIAAQNRVLELRTVDDTQQQQLSHMSSRAEAIGREIRQLQCGISRSGA